MRIRPYSPTSLPIRYPVVVRPAASSAADPRMFSGWGIKL